METFSPRLCAGCGGRLNLAERGICLRCRMQLIPFYNPKRILSHRFYSFRVRVDKIYVGYLYSEGNVIRSIIHHIKYLHHREAGLELGRLIAQKEQFSRQDYDWIIPIPIHKRRIIDRGYNQAALIAKGISEVSGIPLATNALVRIHFGSSQTRKSRQSRIIAMKKAFAKGSQFPSPGQKLLLVDDVLTTGATLSVAASILDDSSPLRLSLLAAVADI